MKKRVALYVRVSTQEQKNHGLSVDSQIAALQEYCENHGYAAVDIYNDAGISARKRYTRRPALLQLLKDCENGEIDLILFTKLDRWFRSVSNYYEVQSILDKNKVPWRAIWEDYETETSEGVFKVNIMLSVAQAEADRTSERVKAVNAYRRANGQYTNGKAPTGYYVSESNLLIDENKFDAVSKGFKAFLTSSNVSTMQEVMKENGVKVSKETAKRMLRNPTYYGDAYGYKCDPYITEEEWFKIQFILGERKTRKPKSPFRTYLFGGLIHCESCGANYHSQVRTMKSGKKTYHYKYYACGRGRNGLCNNTVSISEKKVEKYLVEHLETELNEYIANFEPEQDDSNDYEQKKNAIEQRIKRIGDRYEIGELDKEEYVQKINFLKAELAKLHPAIKKKIPEQLPDDWLSMYNELDDKHKKSFWNQILTNIIIGENGIQIIF